MTSSPAFSSREGPERPTAGYRRGRPRLHQYPSPGSGWGLQHRPAYVEKPEAVRTAQILMYLGAAATVLQVVLTLATRDRIIGQMMKALDGTLTDSQIEEFGNAGIRLAVAFGSLLTILWLCMAWANGGGKSWARIVATCLLALNAILLPGTLTGPTAGWNKLLAVVSVGIGVVTVHLLWRGNGSKAYFESRKFW